ncbi:uncharacterized protein N7518_001841 [Penicillium psychrosexuale]|uniref:uncharacterized protein n=1 Tax=Penicillium psychrosexuale TaxID=1002107 RepID=UPI00254577E3|nr:uncharacterized protein N7518_001841 [Penicillium psychrosexuale]KAJ5799773.1 hypothetical protein N7518_001841 [Penicillium psychrosexuale]
MVRITAITSSHAIRKVMEVEFLGRWMYSDCQQKGMLERVDPSDTFTVALFSIPLLLLDDALSPYFFFFFEFFIPHSVYRFVLVISALVSTFILLAKAKKKNLVTGF